MIVEETFYRAAELAREARTLPADVFNLARILLRRHRRDCLFVPIRSMQYLAVLDHEEFVFVHREGARLIEVAWQNFRPQGRDRLSDPVPYEAVYYAATGAQTMRRLQGDFFRTLCSLERNAAVVTPARVIKLNSPIQ